MRKWGRKNDLGSILTSRILSIHAEYVSIESFSTSFHSFNELHKWSNLKSTSKRNMIESWMESLMGQLMNWQFFISATHCDCVILDLLSHKSRSNLDSRDNSIPFFLHVTIRCEKSRRSEGRGSSLWTTRSHIHDQYDPFPAYHGVKVVHTINHRSGDEQWTHSGISSNEFIFSSSLSASLFKSCLRFSANTSLDFNLKPSSFSPPSTWYTAWYTFFTSSTSQHMMYHVKHKWWMKQRKQVVGWSRGRRLLSSHCDINHQWPQELLTDHHPLPLDWWWKWKFMDRLSDISCSSFHLSFTCGVFTLVYLPQNMGKNHSSLFQNCDVTIQSQHFITTFPPAWVSASHFTTQTIWRKGGMINGHMYHACSTSRL